MKKIPDLFSFFCVHDVCVAFIFVGIYLSLNYLNYLS